MPPSSSSSSSSIRTDTSNSATPPMQSKQQQQQQQQPLHTSSLKILRVANQELSSGNKSGSVFLQLSKGAVAWPLERTVAQARVQRHIQAVIDAEGEDEAQHEM
jgi:hypothetical protein